MVTGTDLAHALFVELVDLGPDARRELLDRRCAERPELRGEVEALLASDAEAEGFLEPPAVGLDDEGHTSLEGRRIGRYVLRRRVGIGGMGAVYEAMQQRPSRKVALKLLRAGLATRELRRRFEQEAEILGRLHHPVIAEIYEAGTHDGELGPIPFFALEFIDGARSITRWADERRLDPFARAEAMAQVCDAVAHAHACGVIHRDIKPSNILVGADGRPRLIDFGVARAADEDGRGVTFGTQIGELVGTLAYMSPEQCSPDGAEVDGRTDVYALGVVLYELLTGRLPYPIERASAAVVLEMVRSHVPAPPELPGRRGADLAAVVCKALEKSPSRRHASAAALADDLRAVIRGEPVRIGGSRAWYRVRRLLWRGRKLVPPIAAAGLVAATAWAWPRAATRAEVRPSLTAFAAATMPTSPGCAHAISRADRALADGDVAQAKAALASCHVSDRDWEWHLLLARIDRSTHALPLGTPVAALIHDPSRALLVAAGENGRLFAFHDPGHHELPRWEPSWQVDTRDEALTILHDPSHARVLVAGNLGEVFAYDLDTGDRLDTGVRVGGPISGLARTDARLFVARQDGVVAVHDLDDGHAIATHMIGDELGAITADGDSYLVARRFLGASRRDAEDGRERVLYDGAETIEAMLVRPDAIYTVGWERGILEFPPGDGVVRRSWPRGADGSVDLVAIDEHTIASAGREGLVTIWDVEDATVRDRLRGHDHGVEALVVDPARRWLVSASLDGTIRTWDLHAPAPELALACAVDKIHDLAWSDDGRVVYSAGGPQWEAIDRDQVVAWSASDGRRLASATDHGATVDAIAVRGALVLSGARDGEIVVRASEDLAPRERIAAGVGPIVDLAFAADGVRFAAIGRDGIAVFASDDRRALARTRVDGELRAGTWAAAAIVAVGTAGAVAWDGEAGVRAIDPDRSLGSVVASGAEVVVGADDGTISAIDLDTGARVWTAPTFGRAAIDLAITPDARRLAVASEDHRIRLHDLATGELVTTVGAHDSVATAVAFAPDGGALATGGFDRRVRLWRAPTAVRSRR